MTFLSLIFSTLYLWIFSDRSHEIHLYKMSCLSRVSYFYPIPGIFFIDNITLVQLHGGYLIETYCHLSKLHPKPQGDVMILLVFQKWASR